MNANVRKTDISITINIFGDSIFNSKNTYNTKFPGNCFTESP